MQERWKQTETSKLVLWPGLHYDHNKTENENENEKNSVNALELLGECTVMRSSWRLTGHTK